MIQQPAMQQILQHQPELAHKLLFVLASTDKEVVRHKASEKEYVGQTMTHHMNHGKHRPFGYLQRWGSHISAAFSTKHKASLSCSEVHCVILLCICLYVCTSFGCQASLVTASVRHKAGLAVFSRCHRQLCWYSIMCGRCGKI